MDNGVDDRPQNLLPGPLKYTSRLLDMVPIPMSATVASTLHQNLEIAGYILIGPFVLMHHTSLLEGEECVENEELVFSNIRRHFS